MGTEKSIDRYIEAKRLEVEGKGEQFNKDAEARARHDYSTRSTAAIETEINVLQAKYGKQSRLNAYLEAKRLEVEGKGEQFNKDAEARARYNYSTRSTAAIETEIKAIQEKYGKRETEKAAHGKQATQGKVLTDAKRIARECPVPVKVEVSATRRISARPTPGPNKGATPDIQR